MFMHLKRNVEILMVDILDHLFLIFYYKHILNLSLNNQNYYFSQEYMDLEFIKKKVLNLKKKNLRKSMLHIYLKKTKMTT